MINIIFNFEHFLVLFEYRPFKIDLYKVVYWLNSRKDRLKNTLINTYIKNTDYKVLPINRERFSNIKINGGQNKEYLFKLDI